MTNKTLKEFLKKHYACKDGYEFAKDLTLEQFLNTCERGDWILWLFVRINPRNKKLRVLVAAQCSSTVRHLMRDERSIKAVDVAIRYGEGKATKIELDAAAYAADAAAAAAYAAYANAAYAANAANAAVAAYGAAANAADAAANAAYAANAANAAVATYGAAANAADAAADAAADDANAAAVAADADAAADAAAAYAAAKKENQKLTADICRKYLPIEVWEIK